MKINISSYLKAYLNSIVSKLNIYEYWINNDNYMNNTTKFLQYFESTNLVNDNYHNSDDKVNTAYNKIYKDYLYNSQVYQLLSFYINYNIIPFELIQYTDNQENFNQYFLNWLNNNI